MSGLKPVDQPSRQLRTFPFVLVLEVDKYVLTACCAGLDRVGPAGQVVILIAFVPKTKVRVRRGDFHRCRQPFAIRHAQGHIAPSETLEDVRIVPRLVAELEGRANPRGKRCEKRSEDIDILLERRWQLKQDYCQFVPERPGRVAERPRPLIAVLQPSIVCDPPGGP